MRLEGPSGAWELLCEYLHDLEIFERDTGTSYGRNRTIRKHRRPKPERPVAIFRASAMREAARWEREQMAAWAEEGRLTQDGTLRVAHRPLTPYTMHDVSAVWPHLKPLSQLAVLIDLDGVVEEGYMESHDNIRKVVETISREQVEKVLQTTEARDRIADICHEQINSVFASLHKKLQDVAPTMRVGGKKQKCGACGDRGHRVTTCPKKLAESGVAAT